MSDDLFALACQPDKRVRLYSGCIADGVRYHTIGREKDRKAQNSGIITEGGHDGEEIDFYGQLRSVIELQYNSSGGIHHSVVLFLLTGLTSVAGKRPGSKMMDISKV